MVQRGPIVFASRNDPANLSPQFRQAYPRRIFVANPDKPAPEQMRRAGFRQIMTPATVAELDLTRPMKPHGKWRNALRKSHNSALSTSHRKLRNSDRWIFDADKLQQSEKRFRALPHAISQKWPTAQTHFATAIYLGSPVAAMLFLLHGNVATYQIGWSSDIGRKYAAHNRLLAETFDCLAARSFKRMDLGSVDTENTAGLARFKIRSGAHLRQLGGTWIAPPPWWS